MHHACPSAENHGAVGWATAPQASPAQPTRTPTYSSRSAALGSEPVDGELLLAIRLQVVITVTDLAVVYAGHTWCILTCVSKLMLSSSTTRGCKGVCAGLEDQGISHHSALGPLALNFWILRRLLCK